MCSGSPCPAARCSMDWPERNPHFPEGSSPPSSCDNRVRHLTACYQCAPAVSTAAGEQCRAYVMCLRSSVNSSFLSPMVRRSRTSSRSTYGTSHRIAQTTLIFVNIQHNAQCLLRAIQSGRTDWIAAHRQAVVRVVEHNLHVGRHDCVASSFLQASPDQCSSDAWQAAKRLAAVSSRVRARASAGPLPAWMLSCR